MRIQGGAFGVTDEDRRIAELAMREAGADMFAKRNVKTLSFGERQRVYLAMQLAQGADNCLFDEPTNFMDIRVKFAMLDILISKKAEGKCIISVLHDVSLAMKYADRIIVMKGGRVAADGTPEELYESGSLADALCIRLDRYRSDRGNEYVVMKK